MKLRVGLVLLLTTVMPAVSATAQRISKGPSTASGATRVDLSREATGRESTKFVAVVGNWTIVDDG